MAASEALIERLRFCWLTLTRDEIHQAADHIEKLEADKARLNDALRQAVIDAAEWARKAGEAQGKLEISEAAGILDGWIRDCEQLRADNARLRRDKETLLTFAQAIQTWRSDADSYDRECEQPQRNYCEDVELMEKAADYALRRVAERAALQETSHD